MVSNEIHWMESDKFNFLEMSFTGQFAWSHLKRSNKRRSAVGRHRRCSNFKIKTFGCILLWFASRQTVSFWSLWHALCILPRRQPNFGNTLKSDGSERLNKLYQLERSKNIAFRVTHFAEEFGCCFQTVWIPKTSTWSLCGPQWPLAIERLPIDQLRFN